MGESALPPVPSGRIWSLPFHFRDRVVDVELRATAYALDSGGSGLQITLESKHEPGKILSIRLPEEKAGGLAMRILATLDGAALAYPNEKPAKAECRCDLVDASTYGGPAYVRGRSNGCLIHPASAAEREMVEAERRRDEAIEAADADARRKAREA